MAISCDPNSLVAAASCFKCLPRTILEEVKTYLLCQYATNATNPGGVMASNWAARVVINGGANPSAASVAALATFWNSLLTAGITGKLITINAFAPDNLIASITPFLVGGGFDPWTNNGPFVAGDLTVNGLLGNGATKYLNTGINPNTVLPDATDGGQTLYCFTANDLGETDIGSNGGANELMLFNTVAGNNRHHCYGSGIGIVNGVGFPAFTGYVSGNRTSASSHAIYVANSVTAHQAAGSNATASLGNRPNLNQFVFARNQNGGPVSFSTKRLSFASIHHGLTQAQSLSFFNAVQALRVAFGGGFI